MHSATMPFGFSSVEQSTQIVNGGINPLAGITVDDSYRVSSPWLTHQLGESQITFFADRDGLAEGIYRAEVTVNASQGGSEIAYIRMYNAAPLASDAGVIYVTLTDPSDPSVVLYKTTARKSQGYNYSFAEVDPGQYRLRGSTDIDNDGLLTTTDNGELYGSYSFNQGSQTSDSSDASRDFAVSFTGLPASAGKE